MNVQMQIETAIKGNCSMQNDLISVVLPIYNVEKYLERCISSVVNQTYRNLEILLVDDGSPDRCPQICDDWAAKDARIHVIHKKNAGLGMARNTGIDHASGKYICFFDSDDYVALNTIELAYGEIQRQNAQIVCFGYHDVDSDGTILRSIAPTCPKDCFSGREVQENFLPNLLCEDPAAGEKWNLNASAWDALFSMDLIHKTGWRFVSEREIISEDVYSLLVLYKHVDRVAVLDEALYYYCRNGASLTRTYRKDRFEKIVGFYHASLEACASPDYPASLQRRLTRTLFSYTIGAMKQIAHSQEPVFKRLAAIRRILRHEVWQSDLTKTSLPHETGARKVLLWCILHRQTALCLLLCWLKRG